MIACPLLDPPTNGNFTDASDTKFGSILTVECEEGFFLTGQNNLECVDDDNNGVGEWNTRLPSCRRE